MPPTPQLATQHAGPPDSVRRAARYRAREPWRHGPLTNSTAEDRCSASGSPVVSGRGTLHGREWRAEPTSPGVGQKVAVTARLNVVTCDI